MNTTLPTGYRWAYEDATVVEVTYHADTYHVPADESSGSRTLIVDRVADNHDVAEVHVLQRGGVYLTLHRTGDDTECSIPYDTTTARAIGAALIAAADEGDRRHQQQLIAAAEAEERA